jgi:hypothetical protein
MYSGSVPGPLPCPDMLRRKVTSPDGRVWKLGRRWMPRRRKIKKVDLSDVGLPDFDGGFLDDLGVVGAIIAAILLVILAVFVALLLFNVIALTIELLLVLVLFVGGLVGRVVFRRPWTIYAQTKTASITRGVVGWRASRRELDDLAARVRSGLELEGAPGDGR